MYFTVHLGNLVNVTKQKTFKSTGDTNEPAKQSELLGLRQDFDDFAVVTKNHFDHVDQRLDRIETNMATKDDLAVIITDQATMKDDIKDLKNNVSDLDYKIDRIDRTQNTIMEILDDNTKILKEIRTLPARVGRLEKAVFHR